MQAIDFLQSPPQYFIFQKKFNKTQYGGILFLIYLVIIFFISLAFILDYAQNDKFEIEYYMVNSFFSKKSASEIILGNFDQNINPETDFQIHIEINDNELNPEFYQNITLEELEKNLFMEYKGELYRGKFCSSEECPSGQGNSFFIFNITKKIFEYGYGYNNIINIIYKCYDKICSNFIKDIFINIYVITPNFDLVHNDSEPIKKYECTLDLFNSSMCRNYIVNDLLEEGTLYLDFKLSSIYYEEKRGIQRLFDYITNTKKKYQISYIEENSLKIDHYPANYYQEEYYIISKIYSEPMDIYEKFMRNELTILTVIANIGALVSTFKIIFILFYQFYSKNYDNYKVVEKILSNELRNSKNKIKFNDKNINISNKTVLNEQNILKKENELDIMTIPLIKDDSDNEKEKENKLSINSEEEEGIIDNKKKENEENNLINEEGRVLPKLCFCEFYLNKIYFKICKKRKKQEIINICNKLVFKYISIDYVLYSLMKLENLFKDYKWNNPELNSIKDNEIIKELLKNL